MCELFGAVLSPARRPSELSDFKYLSIDGNRDGWGVAWYNGGLKVMKGTRSAMADPRFRVASRKANSHIVLAHLRAMTRGNLRKVNNHPFTLDNYVFAHNGTVDIRPLTDYLRGRYRELRGTTDSEFLFRFLVQKMDRWGSYMGLRRAIREISRVARDRKVTSVNFLLSDGEYLYALKRVYSGKNTLHYKKKDGFRKSFVISSDPLGNGWTELENGQLLVVDSSDLSIIETKIMN